MAMDRARTALDWVLEGVAFVTLMAAAGDVAMHWGMLPEQIPVHFGVSGEADGWGDRSMMLWLLAVSAAAWILLTVAGKYQRLINIPMVLDRESPVVRGLLRSMEIAMKVVVMVSLLWIVDLTMRTAVGEAKGLGVWFAPVFLGATIVPLVYYLVKLKRV